MVANKVVTSAEMKEIERKADQSGLSYYQMMENAGTAASKLIVETIPIRNKNVLIFCGKGNNGGDGFVVARKLYEKGAEIKIVLVDGEPKTSDAVKNKEICVRHGLPIINMEDNRKEAEDSSRTADVIVDAVYGTGFHGDLDEQAKKAAKLINESDATIFSLDIPSGLNGDDGKASMDTVNADYTIAFHALKPAHVMANKACYFGRIVCADIGIK